jgi:hypothetical protein
MAADGSILPYVPQAIRFRDADKLRPVAPFFELRTRIQESDGAIREAPLALSILDEFGLGPSDIRFAITVANKKAQRRTRQASCGFIARIDTNGADHTRKPLLATSPHDADHVPLARQDAPVPLGTFQVGLSISSSAFLPIIRCG